MAFNWFRKKKKKPVIKDNEFHLIAREAVFGKFLSYWPKLNPASVHLGDDIYVMPSKEELKRLLHKSRVDEYIYSDGILECNKYALLLFADIVRERYKDFHAGNISKNQLYSLTLGQIWYRDPLIGSHAINLCITHDEGILFAEPQNDKIRKADKKVPVDFINI